MKFAEKLMKYGKVLNYYRNENCDNGVSEMYHIEYTNGVDFVVMMLNGEIINID